MFGENVLEVFFSVSSGNILDVLISANKNGTSTLTNETLFEDHPRIK
jgi:hypothetical protein